MRKIKYNKGCAFGNLIYLKDLDDYISPKGHKHRKSLFRCKCGNEFSALMHSVKSNNTTSCGCYHIQRMKESSTKHGFSRIPLYTLWHQIKYRCYDHSNDLYKNYGGRGVKMSGLWLNDFLAFLDYMIALPNYNKSGFSIDRIDGNGNYEPGNVRWADGHTQAANQVLGKHTKYPIPYIGVSKFRNKFQSKICINHKIIYLGTFANIIDAVIARNEYIEQNKLLEYPIQSLDL